VSTGRNTISDSNAVDTGTGLIVSADTIPASAIEQLSRPIDFRYLVIGMPGHGTLRSKEALAFPAGWEFSASSRSDYGQEVYSFIRYSAVEKPGMGNRPTWLLP
jgi:hypothetical protein